MRISLCFITFFIFSIVDTQALPSYASVENTSRIEVNSVQDLFDGHEIVYWQWQGKIDCTSDVFGGWRLGKGTSTETILRHQYNSLNTIRIRTLGISSMKDSVKNYIETTLNDYLSSLPLVTDQWKILEIENIQSKRPMLGYLPYGYRIKYKQTDGKGSDVTMEEVGFISPSSDRKHLLIISLRADSESLDYIRPRFEKWIATFQSNDSNESSKREF